MRPDSTRLGNGPLTLQVRHPLDLAGLMRWVVIALLPCVAMGIWNTGYQANAALTALGEDAAVGWRSKLIELLRIDYGVSATPAHLLHGALYLVPLLIVATAAAFAWEHLFARARRRPAGEGTMVTALIFTLMLPPPTPLWQCALGVSFAMVFGKLVFGGTGRNFLNPALSGLAFLYFSFPDAMVGDPIWPTLAGYAGTNAYALAADGGTLAMEAAGYRLVDAFIGQVPGTLGQTSVIACLLGAGVLLVKQAASWRVMSAMVLGTSLTAIAFNFAGNGAAAGFGVPWYWHLVLGGVAFGAIFVATDPVSAPMTDAGRWVYGMLIGAAVVLIRLANPAHPDGVLLAILLGNVAAPLIDYAVVWAQVRRRMRLGGRA